MADVNVTELTQETYSTIDGTEQVIMFDSAEGKRATVAAVGEYVLKKLTTSLNGSTQTVANALSSLNSDMTIKVNTADDIESLLFRSNSDNVVRNFYCSATVTSILTNGDSNVTARGFYSETGNIMDYVISTALGAIYQGRYDKLSSSINNCKKATMVTVGSSSTS